MSEGTYDSSKVIDALYQSVTASSIVSKVSVGSSAAILLLINPERAFTVLQNTGSVLYVKFGLGAALDSYSFCLSSNAKASIDRYGGVITAVRNSSTDDVFVTEVY